LAFDCRDLTVAADRIDEARAFAAWIHKPQSKYIVENYLVFYRFSEHIGVLFRSHVLRRLVADVVRRCRCGWLAAVRLDSGLLSCGD
jgi:hypothetical protein